MIDSTLLDSCKAKQKRLIQLFDGCSTPQEKYEKIIELGKQLPLYPSEFKFSNYRVMGCQSQMYLHASMLKEEAGMKIEFQVFSEALISAGLAALLLFVYNKESPIAILKCPPDFLHELGIHDSLSAGRSNGLASLFLRMKQEALFFLSSCPL